MFSSLGKNKNAFVVRIPHCSSCECVCVCEQDRSIRECFCVAQNPKTSSSKSCQFVHGNLREPEHVSFVSCSKSCLSLSIDCGGTNLDEHTKVALATRFPNPKWFRWNREKK